MIRTSFIQDLHRIVSSDDRNRDSLGNIIYSNPSVYELNLLVRRKLVKRKLISKKRRREQQSVCERKELV
jgi:hypothetical protein